MRIRRLSLDFFGHFTGKTLDFGAAGQGSDFHVIYGSNEAGKTTTMEAWLRLLYGFPHRDPYGFQHQRQNLRVSGLLDLGGETRPFTRLPSRSGNLRGEAEAILPEAAIAAHLGGLSLEDYRSLLCLDDETIEKGGEDIANARGDIGRLLFSAAAGVADLNAVLEQERAEAATLYRKRASSTRLAELKRDLAEVDRAIRDTDVTAHAWRGLKGALEAARGEEAEARAARDALRREQARVAALRRALPRLGELDRLLVGIADASDYPERIDIDPDALIAMTTERAQAEADLQRLSQDLAGMEEDRAALVLDAERLALSERLDALDELRSRMQTAALDLPRRRRACEEAEADMARVALDLGAPEGCDVTLLVTAPAEIATLEDLRETMRDVAIARDAGVKEIADQRSRIAQARRAHQSLLDDPPARTGLLDLLARFDADTLAPAVATATAALASADSALRDAIDALTVGACRFDALPDCPVDPATAADLAERHADRAETVARLDERLREIGEDRAGTQAKMSQLAEGAGVATDAQAHEARTLRDTLWRAHRDALTPDSADRFEPAMRLVDEIGAARLAHATELGELRKLGQDLAEAEARAATIGAQRDSLAGEVADLEAEARALAARTGLPPLSPAALSDWVARHAAAADTALQRDRLTAQHRDTLDRADRLRAALVPLVGLDDPTFDAALRAARRLSEAERDYRDRLRAASERVTGLEDELARRQDDQDRLETAATEAASAWASRVQALFGDLLPPDRLAAAPAQLRDLREHDTRRLQAERQITTMQDDQSRFAAAMADLGARFGVAEDDPLRTFARLREIAAQAEADRTRHEDLGIRLDEHRQRCADLETTLADIDRTVATLGATFPATVDTGSLDALRIAVGTGLDVIARRERIATVRAEILDDLSLRTLDEARALIGEETAPGLEAHTALLETDLDAAEERLSRATVARANAERDLAAVTGSAEIADLVERRATLQMQIEETVLDYLERDFGLRLADEAIRRYRDRHRSAMMAATERAFSDLTAGAYRSLLTQPDGASEILLAIDASGTPKQIGDLSKGTRFQLYLALRAAAYEQMVAQGVRLPFFCDDVFETFDEDRTCAACTLMDRIGRSGQAIYLTHHRHVVEIAKAVCEVQPTIHEL